MRKYIVAHKAFSESSNLITDGLDSQASLFISVIGVKRYCFTSVITNYLVLILKKDDAVLSLEFDVPNVTTSDCCAGIYRV